MTERDEGALCADSEPVAAEEPPMPPAAGPAADEQAGDSPSDHPAAEPRVGCRTELRGWAGAHLHGAVRPRRRAVGRGRPPGRWC